MAAVGEDEGVDDSLEEEEPVEEVEIEENDSNHDSRVTIATSVAHNIDNCGDVGSGGGDGSGTSNGHDQGPSGKKMSKIKNWFFSWWTWQQGKECRKEVKFKRGKKTSSLCCHMCLTHSTWLSMMPLSPLLGLKHSVRKYQGL